eukprot:Hpha_TRINITY_DN13528_c0_g1::TRINITY_DN13528_c0_g1_i1::g.111706::m.111706
MRGKVVKWIEERGFGFISPDDGGKDVYVHARDLPPESSLEEGRDIHFDLVQDSRAGGKDRATNIDPDSDAIVGSRMSIDERKRKLDERAERGFGRGRDRSDSRDRRRRDDSRDRRRRDRSDSRDKRRRRRRSPSESDSRSRRRR